MAKKKNSRKALAVALGIMGIAGLSVASASSLIVNPQSDNLAMGTRRSSQHATTAVKVDYTYGDDCHGYVQRDLVISGIAPACDNKTLQYTLGTTRHAGEDHPRTIVTGVRPAPRRLRSPTVLRLAPYRSTTGLGKHRHRDLLVRS